MNNRPSSTTGFWQISGSREVRFRFADPSLAGGAHTRREPSVRIVLGAVAARAISSPLVDAWSADIADANTTRQIDLIPVKRAHHMGSGLMAEVREIKHISVDDLLLDPDNPRLPEDLQGGKQLEILRHIARHEAVEDLMAAIGRNGYFEGEPLVVYRNANDPKSKWRVIEGNRRLASVKLLRNPALYSDRPSLKEIANESPARNKPESLPVVKVEKREDSLPYLGSRHIVGVKAWEPLPKARYMLQLFNTTPKSRSAHDRYRDVARRIGSGNRTDYVRKNLNALAVYNLIVTKDFFGDKNASELDFKFGVLYTALERSSIAGYAGVVKYDAKVDNVLRENHPILKPSELKPDHVKDLYNWCFRKDERGQTILGESRNIPKLASVLRSAEATSVLKNTKSLDVAYERSGGVVQELSGALSVALTQLRYANSVIANADHDELVTELASKVLEQAKSLHVQVLAKAGPKK